MAEPMEIEQAAERISLPALPAPDASRLHTGPSGQTVRWIELSASEPNVYARTMKALASHPEVQQDMFGKLAVQFLLPVPVHDSPLRLMLTRPMKTTEEHTVDAYRPRIVSSLASATWLNELLLYYTDTHVRVAIEKTEAGKAETESGRVSTIDREWFAQRIVLDEQLFRALDALYAKHGPPGPVGDAQLVHFVELMTRYTYDYLHLLEYTIWRIADADHIVPLECVLTPVLSNFQCSCTKADQSVITRTFSIKSLANNAQLSRTGCAHLVHDWFPSLTSDPLQPGEWMNRAMLVDYYHYMDMDDLAK